MRPTLLLAPLSAPAVLAWGRLGHDTVAFIAQNYLSPRTERWAQSLLGDNSTHYLANVSAWADAYRNEAGGAFSAPFHYISAADSAPPRNCSVDFERDCGPDGCVVSAIANYTRRVAAESLPRAERDYALRFLVHFLGDIHQPLHNEAYEAGANGVFVTFDNATRNLHATWDTQIPERGRGSYTRAQARLWADYLIGRIEAGVYARDVSIWTAEDNVKDGLASALRWSREANGYVCETVAPQGWEALEVGDLAVNGYYDSAVPKIELQLARAGIRLAKWLVQLSGGAGPSVFEEQEDLSGADLLPQSKKYTAAQLKRRAQGYGCGCGEHEH